VVLSFTIPLSHALFWRLMWNHVLLNSTWIWLARYGLIMVKYHFIYRFYEYCYRYKLSKAFTVPGVYMAPCVYEWDYYFDYYYLLNVSSNLCCLLIEAYSGVCCNLLTRVDWLCAQECGYSASPSHFLVWCLARIGRRSSLNFEVRDFWRTVAC
jgi:hypothetical protein